MRPPSIESLPLALFFAGIFAAQHARDRFMYPRIDLQVAIFLRGEPEFNRAIAADKGLLLKARRIFDANPQQPLAEFATTYHAVKSARM
jgi:hypothetical protein